MSTLSGILNTSRRALLIQQLAMQVIGQNTANVNTEGYARRRLDLTTAPPADSLGMWLGGGGVDVDHMGRVRDRILDEQYRNNASTTSYWSERDERLGRIEEVFDALGETSIGDQLTEFWNGWQDLANHPEDMAPRIALTEEARALAASITRTHAALTAEWEQNEQRLADKVSEVNQLTSRIARLNVEISGVEVGGAEASDQRDQRDLALDRLSALLDITAHETPDGVVNVFHEGQVLVQVDITVELSVSRVAGDARVGGRLYGTVTQGTAGRPLHFEQGEIKAILDARDQDLMHALTNLDRFAVALTEQVNALHLSGYGLAGSTGIEFFRSGIATAADFALSGLVADDPRRIATALSPNAPGDNALALRIANLQHQRVLEDGQATLGEFFRNAALAVGARKSHAASQRTVEEAALANLDQRRQQVSGVSLDEEMTRLMQVQQAYEAAAKMISTVDEMMQTVLNM